MKSALSLRAVVYLVGEKVAFACFPIVSAIGADTLSLAFTALAFSAIRFAESALVRLSARQVLKLVLHDRRSLALSVHAGWWSSGSCCCSDLEPLP